MRRTLAAVMFVLAGSVLVLTGCHDQKGGGLSGGGQSSSSSGGGDTYTVEYTDYKTPPPKQEELTDDRLEDKPELPFLPQLVDRRPMGKDNAWRLNASAAVIKLDVPIIKPDAEKRLLELHASYAQAVKGYYNVLPSVNLLDGKCKQFDDGLYAALDQAYYQGLKDKLQSHIAVVRKFYDKVDAQSETAAYLAAGLELAGVKIEAKNPGLKAKFRAEFEQTAGAKPISFYTWNDTLKQCWRFMKFFQLEFDAGHLGIPQTLAAVLAQDTGLRADYDRINAFYAKLTNPLICLSITDLPPGPIAAEAFKKLCKDKKVDHEMVALLPPSTSRESVLFDKLFPNGLPPNANLMNEFIKRIKSGEVDLTPRPSSGWYEYQVYALETMLLPEKGDERSKLLLTKQYKKRMLEAFQALVTKRRETHARQLYAKDAPREMAAPPPPPDFVEPRLRVEPCPTYYLRTARAYAFLANFLESALGKDTLTQLHGLKQGGERQLDLFTELTQMRDLCYGLYLISCEDIGQPLNFAKDEPVDQEKCLKLATDWLPDAFKDEDLAADTRVSVPLYVDVDRQVTRLWLTLGVRMAKLDANYVRPPSLKPVVGEGGEGEWKPVEPHRLRGVNYVIAVDEFAEVELKGVRALTREELRAICDREKTKERIIAALSR
jgi:hypothetical protein